MDYEEQTKSVLNTSQLTLFRFEVNRSQASLFLIISLMGVFMLPFNLAGEVFLNLFDYIFDTLPTYLENPGVYHEDYLYYNFIPIVLRLIVFSIFLSLSIYGVRRILKNKTKKEGLKRKIISQGRVINWFGLKISHGQSLFIFSASLAGIIFLVQHFIEPGSGWGLLESLCWIPDGPNVATSNVILLKYVPIAIQIIFFLICLYSLFITRRGRKMTSSVRIIKNYSLLIFISFFVVLILLSARIFCHLAMFNRGVSSLLGLPYNAPNQYQNNDFLKTVVIFCIFLFLMIISFFLRKRDYSESKASDDLSWFHIKLTPYRATILLSAALICVIFFTNFYLMFLFLFESLSFYFAFYNIMTNIIFIAIIIFCYYPIEKILKDNHFEIIIENINKSGLAKTDWFKTRLDKSQAIILLSVSCGLIILYIFQLLLLNMQAQAFYSNLEPWQSYLLVSFPLMSIIIFLIIAINVYTIIKTLPSIKNSQLF